MLKLHGQNLIGDSTSVEGTDRFRARNPATGEDLEPAFFEAAPGEIDRALRLAAQVFPAFRDTPCETRAAFLEAVAGEVEALGDQLVETAQAETALPRPRCEAERGRAIGQARLFAAMIREGSWIDARIDLPQPGRAPLPKPDVRSMLRPVGPVVVFGASNFPIAISVFGCDTVSALAAGCPVIVKAHPAHPATCELLARAFLGAAEECGLPDGVFSMVHGRTNAVGLALVNHPETRAVAFTGSLAGGRALFDAASARPQPIPFYGEMGSINPVFLLPGALKEKSAQIAAGFIQSLALGVGQFCTNPGLVFGLEGDDLKSFVSAAAKNASGIAPATMLHAGIHRSFVSGIEKIESMEGVSLAGRSGHEPDSAKSQAACCVFETDSAAFIEHPELFEEVFGPVSTVVKCQDAAELKNFASKIDGSLTATIHGTIKDLEEHGELVAILESRVGRLVFNGYPTGIEVCAAMHHGGPYPASTHGHFTSIGTRSIERFVRPVCYQGWPQEALPEELRNRNSRGIWRMIENEWTRDDCPP